PDPHSKVLHCPDGGKGSYAYICLTRVIALYPNYTGYLMAHFDVLPIFYNLEKKDLSRIWIPPITLTDPSKANDWQWPASHGKQAFDGFFSTLRNSGRNNSLYSKYLDNYMRNAGKNLTSSFSDIFYLPKRFVSDWFILTDLMLQNHLFLEIGFAATSLLMTSTTISKEIIQLNGERWSEKDLVISLHDKNNLEYYHRIDHQSKLHQVELILDFDFIRIIEVQQKFKMNIIIPMGGIGHRFSQQNYRFPKPLIKIVGRPILFWLLDNLDTKDDDITYIGLMKNLEKQFGLTQILKTEYPKRIFQFILIDFETRGAAETLFIILQSMSKDRLERKTISLDCDTIY
ncbi:unnamed protein product, partial [Adineta steineri]